MNVPIDRAGRVVVPKAMREELGLSPEVPLDIEIVDDHLELRPVSPKPRVVEGRNGPVVAASGTPVSDSDVRRVLEAARERR
jgi:AbrB family looped-hinge helix DNA binding protein